MLCMSSIADIQPSPLQPRQHFDEAAMTALASASASSVSCNLSWYGRRDGGL